MKKKHIVKMLALSMLLMILFSSRMRNFLLEFGHFFIAFFKSPADVGSVMPSSEYLAQAITRYVDTTKGPIKILEVGAGTGVFTQEIVDKMKPDDQLDVVEIDSGLCNLLEEKFTRHKNVHIHCRSILDWKPPYVYDFIISGLPFNAFSANFVAAILQHYKTLLKPNGMFSYFEYIASADIKKAFLQGQKKEEYLKNLALTLGFLKKFIFDIDIVLLNIPPAYVYHLKIPKVDKGMIYRKAKR